MYCSVGQAPGISSEFVELVDMFPTVVDAAGLEPIDPCPEDNVDIKVCTEGVSFMSLIRGEADTWKETAFSWYPRDQGQTMG